MDVFPIQYGQKRVGLGMRPSRSYVMLTNMGVEADKEAVLLSLSGCPWTAEVVCPMPLAQCNYIL